MTKGIDKWEDDFNTGDEEIDEQHKQVFTYINQLHSALKLESDEVEIQEILTGLSEFSVSHFKLEEEKMLASKYPKYDSHKEEHILFIERLSKLSLDKNEKNKSINLRLLKFLKAWFSSHVLNTDKKFFIFLLGEPEKPSKKSNKKE